MGRTLSPEMNIIGLDVEFRRPAYQLQIYDIRSGLDTIGDVVTGQVLDSITGPRNFTPEVSGLSFSERAGDFIATGIVASDVSFALSDPDDLFNPANLLQDPTGDGRWLREGNVVRLLEGDVRVDVADWAATFTGVLHGQAGIDRNRGGQNTATLQCKAVGREAAFLRSSSTSTSYPNGSTYLFMAQDVAESDMGLSSGEINFSGFGNTITTQKTTQFVEQPAIVTIAQLMFIDGAMPHFDGDGILTSSNGLVSQSPQRSYADLKNVVSLTTPATDEKAVNSVCVVGLNGTQEKLLSERQTLGNLTITTGFFANNERVKRYLSEDKTLMADNLTVIILRSVNGGMLPLNAGGGETIELIPAPLPATSGSVGVIMTVTTGFAPYLIIMLTVTYVFASWIPDYSLPFGGPTIPLGRATQALLLISIQMIMGQIGRGEYEFEGEPFEYVFKEIRACAEVDGLTSETRVEVEVNNHLVNTQAKCDNIAREMLFRQQARGNVREMELLADLKLQADDVFEIPDRQGRRFLIGSISRSYGHRNNAAGGTQAMQVFEVTEGIVP